MLNKFFLCCIFILSGIALKAQSYIVGSYNIRYANPRDSGNLWEDRAPVVANLIRFHDFDLLGTQEGFLTQLNDISEALPQYARYGRGRDDGNSKGEHSAIFYKKDKFKVINKGDFWLSETPDTPSLGWDATCCHRICSWLHLQDVKTKKQFFIFNAHFDHQGVKAREESSKLILQNIQRIAGNKAVIFMGDLNGSHQSEWYKKIAGSEHLKDTYTLVEKPYANNASHNSFRIGGNRKDIIDHIFISKDFTVSKWGLLTDTYHGKFPSDHFPVLAVITLK